MILEAWTSLDTENCLRKKNVRSRQKISEAAFFTFIRQSITKNTPRKTERAP